MECIIGCGTGGAIYLLLLMSGVLWFQSTFVAIFLAWPFLMILGFFAGAISGTLVSMVMLPINASLGWPLKSLWFSFIVGGLSGLVPFCLVLLQLMLSNYTPQDEELMFLVAIGSAPAMLLGHLSAYWLTEKVVNDHNERFGVIKHKTDQPSVRHSRFNITHIMTFTIWVALGFFLLSLFTTQQQILLVKFFLMSQVAAGLVAIIVIWLVSCVRRYRKRNVSASNH